MDHITKYDFVENALCSFSFLKSQFTKIPCIERVALTNVPKFVPYICHSILVLSLFDNQFTSKPIILPFVYPNNHINV